MQPRPQFFGRGEVVARLLQPGQRIEFDDAVAVAGIGKLQPQHRGVFLRLLHALARRLVLCLGFDDGDWVVACVAQQIIGAFLFAATDLTAYGHDAAIGEGHLLVDAMRGFVPASSLEFGDDIDTASISFVHRVRTSEDKRREGRLANHVLG